MMIHSVTNRFQFFSFFLDSQILDLGCGDGAVGEALKAKGFEDLIGIDISKGMLDIAQNKGTYTSLKKGDLQQTLPFEDGTFDCAVSSAVSTYLSELRALNKFSKFYLSNIALNILHFFQTTQPCQIGFQSSRRVATSAWCTRRQCGLSGQMNKND